MLTGRSIYHVDQQLGKAINKGGYYNDLTQKVLKGENNLDERGIPFLEHSDGSRVQMPIMIFQYGLGAYDLYLLHRKNEYLEAALKCSDWAIDNQNNNGSWDTFSYVYSEHPFSAMSQGEGASLLLRIYRETNERKYLIAAKKAVDFMLVGLSEGGVSKTDCESLYLLEYTNLPIVLNGWIFASWGILDLSKFFPEYSFSFDKTVRTMIGKLPDFDNGYWSFYDLSGKISSPFYHKLHIAQIQAMFLITNEKEFEVYHEKFMEYESRLVNKAKAFIVKAIQKIKE